MRKPNKKTLSKKFFNFVGDSFAQHLTVTLGVMDPPYYTPDCILENLVKEAKDKAISEISVTNVKVPSFSVANSSFSLTYSQLSSEMHFLSRLLLLESQLHIFNVLDPGWEFSVSILQSSVTIVNGEIHDDYIAVSGVVDFDSDVTMEEITVQVTNEERMDDSPGAVFDVMVQTEKEENSSGDA
ncbi:hypothetical protein F2Q69_00007930 [Brassica cretica]|uniref:Uncharacterized protein n=1 Tax=Brassica cretica TaxID=69181 RepID=A0A8S9PBT4_BRACR|nr:hypothetical protein F2Q69_00007930 [Brassica cretica]